MLLRHAGFTVLHEPRGYLVLSNKRPDFIIDDQQQFFIDVRTCDPCIPRIAPKSSSTPGFAADLGTKEKNRNWLDLVEAQGDSFLAICHESPVSLAMAHLVSWTKLQLVILHPINRDVPSRPFG